MMRPWMLVFLLVPFALAGCADEGPATEDPTPPTAPMPEARGPVAYNATGCSLLVTAIVRPMDTFPAFLPEGYTPADASGLLGLPIETGMGAALATVYRCASSEFLNDTLLGGELNILVQDPGIDAGRPADNHYYIAAIHLPDGPVADLLEADGWPVHRGTIDLDMILDSALVYASGQIPGAYGMALDAAAPSTLGGLSRFYTKTPNGTSWFDYDVQADVLVGTSAFTPEGLALDIATIGLVAPPVEVPGIAVPGFDWVASYHPPVAPASGSA